MHPIKQCTVCREWKSVDAFHRFRGAWHPRCRECRSRERMLANADPEVRAVVEEFAGAERTVARLLGRSWPRRIARARRESDLVGV